VTAERIEVLKHAMTDPALAPFDMEGISQDCLFLRRIAGALKEEKFTLIDVGCSLGIENLSSNEKTKINAWSQIVGLENVGDFVGYPSSFVASSTCQKAGQMTQHATLTPRGNFSLP
jgi:hypothetical protein